jgi:L-asparaginase / beta-aspartyl-peptidase
MALDRMGNVAMSFNTEGMYRGYIDISGRLVIQLYKD